MSMHKTPPIGNPIPIAERIAARAESTADRAFNLAKQSGDTIGALQHVHGELSEQQGKLARQIADHVTSTEKGFQEIRGLVAEEALARKSAAESTAASLARLELKMGTRTAGSLSEEALAKLIGVEAAERQAAVEIRHKNVELRNTMLLRVFAAVGGVLTSATVIGAIVALVASQINGCSVTPLP